MIRTAQPSDGDAIAAIYNPYVVNSVVTFETSSVDGVEMASRITETIDAGLPYLVAVEDDRVVGYTYASKWKGRCAYSKTVESSVYIDASFQGHGIGKKLYVALLDSLRTLDMHTVIGGIALPNEASIALHESLGFHKVAHFEQVGHKLNGYVDVGYWQKILE